jgi:outer membrane protein
MKNSFKSLLVLAAFGVFALTGQAQTATKILVVDMAKLLDSHYKTQEQNEKLRGDGQKAQEELDRLNKEGNALVEQYKELVDQSNNPAATAEAKNKVQTEAQRKMEEIQRKTNEVRTFEANTQRALQGRIRTFRDLMFEEIGKIATDVAKRRGASLLVDKSGPSLLGIPAVIYFDPALDITDEVMKEINKDRPASASATTPPASAPAPAAGSSSDSPVIKVPMGGQK